MKLCLILFTAIIVCFPCARSFAQTQVPADVGTVVDGAQDDFDGTSLSTNWSVAGQNVFSVAGGMLHVTSLSTATNLANYQLSGPGGNVLLSHAVLDVSQTNVLLGAATLVDQGGYVLTDNNVADQSHAANVIAFNSQTQFTDSLFIRAVLGPAAFSGSQVPVGSGYNISAGGVAFGGTNDGGQLDYRVTSGDFDFMVRLDSLSLADPWTEAGLMAREDLNPGSISASVLATPSISGTFFEGRSATNASAAVSGHFPVNYPNTWLRLKRSGNVLSGYGSLDGRNWTQLGSLSAVLPSSLYFGFGVSSHNTNQLATVAFRDLHSVTNAGVNGPLPIEPLGQCSRRTSLVLSEIMYHPTNSNLEFVELFNSRGEPQDLSGYQLSGSVSYTFPAGSVVEGGRFAVVAKSPPDLQTAYGLTNIYGPLANSLPNGAGTIRLLSQAGAVLLEVNYGSTPPWPVSPDGAGHSLVLARPSYGEDNVLAWMASDSVGGSPGSLDSLSPEPLRGVVINEFLAGPYPGTSQFVELFNSSAQPADLSGCGLSDDPKTNKVVLPPATLVAAHGFLVLGGNNLGFALNPAGGSLYLRNASGTRVLDAVRYEAQQPGISFGRVPDGAPRFQTLTQATPGLPNSSGFFSDIVINEIMYAPISLDDDDQYLELYNRSTNSINLGGWRFIAGIGYTFPSNTILAPDSYLVVARNAERMRINYPNLNAGNLAGNFTGTLSHRGERVALAQPQELITTNGSMTSTNTIYAVVNEVTYQAGGQWGDWSHAAGSSLELIDPHADNGLAPNWADSDETHKGGWTLISATGTIDNGDVPADELQVLLQGVGEILVDNVQVVDAAGSNHIANGTFESGGSGWFAEGTEKTSSLETSEGFNSAQSYHLRAVNKADNQVNRVRTLLTSALPAGSTNVTIRAAVRWLKGDPEVLLRLRGNWLECAAELPTPTNLGTPGQRNSRYVANAPPSITDVRHQPVLPAAAQPILVTARVRDPDGVGSVLLKYRLDPNSSYSTVAMSDNGAGGDVTAGDGIWTATIPGQAAGTMIAFYIQASDQATVPATSLFPNNAPTRECLVRVGEVQPPGNFPVYRIWMTQKTLNTWNSNPRLDNSDYPVTFVLDDQRVIYGSGARFKGSPYISPGYCGATCGRCGYSISFPDDDLFLGETELVLDWPGGHGGETTALQEQMCYWIADRLNLPWSHRHTIRLHVNGVTDDARQATFEAVVQPVSTFVKEWSPNDSSGELFKIERAFEFNDSDGLIADPEPRLFNYTTTGGVKKREHYRWNFMFRTTDRRDDYTNIFALVDAVNAASPEPYTSSVESLVDLDEWMGIFATEHIIENFDAYGHEIGKNMYAYLPPSGKWQLYMFDLDWAMLAAPIYSSRYLASAGPLFNTDDPTIARLYAFPPFARAYWRAIQHAVDGPLDPQNCNPVIDAKSRSLFSNGITWCDGQKLTEPSAVKTWFSQRRAALQAQLAAVAAPFNVTSVLVSNDVALVSGTAPVAVQGLLFNGSQWPLSWTSVSNWTATVVLQPGTNTWSIVGINANGASLPGMVSNATAVYNNAAASAIGQLVINEIMYAPPLVGGEFVELYNNSHTQSFDLSGWEFKGLSYTFPAGALIGPGSFLVLAANRAAFAAAYGATNLVFDTFAGVLQSDGETLTLTQPANASGPAQIIAKVRYGNALPWPAMPFGSNGSVQLVDPTQDNWRVGNWRGVPGSQSPGASSSVLASLPPFQPLWLNEIQADNLSGPTNSAGQHVPWLELYNPTANPVSLTGLYLSTNYSNPTAWGFPAGATVAPGEFKIVFADAQPALSSPTELHAGFTLPSGSGSLALSRVFNGLPQVLDYLDYTNIGPNHSYGSIPDGQSFIRQEFSTSTPGGTNQAPVPASFIAYLSPGSVYSQDFNSLPNPGAGSVNAANPVIIGAAMYSLADPFAFSDPVLSSGVGGLGIADMAGWYALGSIGSKLGASAGDQTTGGAISFGLPSSSDRALGLLATSSTGATAIGARFVNETGLNLSFLNIRVTGEVWRESNLPKELQCFYFVDPTGEAPFPTSPTSYLPALDVVFPPATGAIGGIAVDGTAAANQTNLVIMNQAITAWLPGAALWLVWQMTDASGKAQGLAIDNLTLSASDQPFNYSASPLGARVAGNNLFLTWLSLPGQTYQLEYKDDLSAPSWTWLGPSIPGTGEPLTLTNNIGSAGQRFFRLTLSP